MAAAAAHDGSSFRWERYAAGTEVEHFAWWTERYLRQTLEPFQGLPLILERWQLEFMGEALAVDEFGRQLWQSVALIVSRKNGKTQLLAAYALYRLLNDDGYPEILLAAASDKNAGRLFEAVVLFIRANPELEQQVHLREYIGEIVRRDGGGKIIRLATDPTTIDGYNPSLVVCDELHAWTKPRLVKMFAKLVSAGGSRTKRQVFTITTAGEAADRKAGILGRLLDGNEEAARAADEADGDDDIMEALEQQVGLTISRNRAGQTLVYNYSAPTLDPSDLASMKLANPASWVTTDYLGRQDANPELTNAEVLQFHGCVWAAGERTWLDPHVFEQLSALRKLDESTACVLMFDGSYSRDSTALVGATIEEKPHVWLEAIWEKPPDAGGDWRTPRIEVLAAIADALERYDVEELAMDPPGWHREVEELEQSYGDELVLRFETNQPRRMGPACDDFVQAVLGPGLGDPDDLTATGPLERGDPELTHDGSEVLIRHIANCVPVPRSGYTVVTKEHPDSPRKIDAAVGAIVAYHRAKWRHTNLGNDLGAILIDTSPPSPQTRG